MYALSTPGCPHRRAPQHLHSTTLLSAPTSDIFGTGKDVHQSSGVANHFFYLLSEGSGAKTIDGVKYDSPTSDGLKVTGIGRAKALKVWYKALTEYMTSTTDYKGARKATLSAASALYGASSTEYKAVAAAWTAVNVK